MTISIRAVEDKLARVRTRKMRATAYLQALMKQEAALVTKVCTLREQAERVTISQKDGEHEVSE